MEGQSGNRAARIIIGVALIICGTFSIVATLGMVAFIINLVFKHATSPSPFRSVQEWVIPLIFLAFVAGMCMIVIGIVVGVRRPKPG